ncbi:MAG: GFA family protein [Pseudooceanicola sp.]|nr:GFA family protein [Pseudooceanicola sp.]
MSEIRRATCHCGAVEIEVELPNGLSGAGRCDCSFCRRRQAANVSAVAATVKVLRGADNLALYTWGTHTARHWFCKTCGIYTHHQRRSDPSVCGVNIGCFEGVHPKDFEPVPWAKGIKHPSDDG